MAVSGGAPLTGAAKPGPAKPAPIQVRAHTRAAPAAKPAKAKPQVNPLLNPNQTLSGQSLLKAAQGLADAQVNPSITDLQKQIAANNAQTSGTIKLTGGFYNQLEPFVQNAAGQSGQIASGLNTQLQGIASDTQNQIAGLGQNALSSLLKYAPQGDGGLANAATSDLAAQIARQQGLAAQQAGTYRAFGATQGANNQQFTNALQGVYGLQGQEALRNIAQSGTVKNEPLESKVAGLIATRGALTATDLGKLRQQEVANQISRAGLGIKQQTLQNTVANDQARNALTARGQNITAANDQANQALKSRSLSVAQQNDLAGQALRAAQLNEKTQNDAANQALKQAALNLKAASSRKGGRPLTTQQNDAMYRLLGQVESLITESQHTKVGPDGKPTTDGSGRVMPEAEIRSHLQSGLNPAKRAFDPVLIEAAYELLGWGYLTPATAIAMRGMGMRGGTFRGEPVRVGAPKAQPNPLMPAPGTQNPLAPASTGL